MERTEYFNYTRPTQTQLDNTETSKINAILRRQRATAQLGTVNGFEVTPNSLNATLIDIGPGEGYTGGMYQQLNVTGEGSSERIAQDSILITGQGLADYTLGALNYVTLVYAETTDTPLAETVFPFLMHDTEAHESYTVSVLTAAAWAALTIAQLRQLLLVAIVTAQGPGNPITSANIQQTTQPMSFPTTNQPVNITGVSIAGLAPSTLIGSGQLRWSVSTKQLFWTAPGDTEGSGVTIITSGSYTLQSATTSYWITVYAISAALPATNQTDVILVQSLYGKIFPRYSAIDSAHREMLGSGEPTLTNPHGLTEADIGGGGTDHAGLFHVNGISVDALSNQLAARIDTDPSYRRVFVHSIGGRPNTFLIAGTMYQNIVGVSPGSDAIVAFDVPPAPASGEYMIYLDDAANIQSISIGTVLWSANICLVDMLNQTAGNCTITWNATTQALTYQAQGDGSPGTPEIVMGNGYYKLYSSNTLNWVIVYVSGSLGGSSSTTFATSKSETTNADNSILKIAVVNWDLTTETLSNLRDIRQWGSADWRDIILEEHDANGYHTKVLQNQFRVAVQTGPAISAYAATGPALAMGAQNSAMVGSAATAGGLVGLAAVSAVVGQATSVFGVYASAPNSALGAYAATVVAGYFSAPASALVATAATAVAASFSAPTYGLMVGANNTALVVNVATAAAIIASAPYSAMVAVAATQEAVYASAPNAAVVAVVGTAQAIIASAPSSAIVANAAVAQAGYFSAPNSVLVIQAASELAISAAANLVAIQANASQVGIAVFATITAAYFSALAAPGIYVEAGQNAIVASVSSGFVMQATGDTAFGLQVPTHTAAGAIVSYIDLVVGMGAYKLALYAVS
jgi:hypothetical protein